MDDYVIYTEAEVSEILSHFNTDYILDTIDDNIGYRLNFYAPSIPNIVISIESFYKELIIRYENEVDSIKSTRNDTYETIISILCNKFNLSYNNENIQDNYSVALYLYKFLISEFKTTIISFFTNFIYKEKNSLYESLRLDDIKKDKSNSSAYTKKLYKNQKLATINANLEYVIDNICNFDISFMDVLNNVFIDKNTSKFMESVIIPNGDFFKENIVFILQQPAIKPICITNIRLALQGLCMGDDNINEIIKQEEVNEDE